MTVVHPSLSVVICTHNRARDLETALESLAAQEGTRARWEVLVVDNASTDETRAVASHWSHSLPLRVVREQKLGLSRARNTGWQQARGDIIAYLDDDAMAAPDWLDVVVRRFTTTETQLGVVGGRVDPVWEAPRPPWLSNGLSLGLTILDWSDRPMPIVDVRREWLVGANIAFRRAALVAAGGFHPALDRAGSSLLSSGDTYLTRRLLELGFTCEYLPDMRVRHRVPANRLTQDWFRSRYFWQGVSDAVIEQLDAALGPPARLARASRRAASLLTRPSQLLRAFTRTEDPAVFEQQCWTLIELGHVARLLGVA